LSASEKTKTSPAYLPCKVAQFTFSDRASVFFIILLLLGVVVVFGFIFTLLRHFIFAFVEVYELYNTQSGKLEFNVGQKLFSGEASLRRKKKRKLAAV
jgi:hypothetical protein